MPSWSMTGSIVKAFVDEAIKLFKKRTRRFFHSLLCPYHYFVFLQCLCSWLRTVVKNIGSMVTDIVAFAESASRSNAEKRVLPVVYRCR